MDNVQDELLPTQQWVLLELASADCEITHREFAFKANSKGILQP